MKRFFTSTLALVLLLAMPFAADGKGKKTAQKPAPEVQNVILMIGDGMGLAHITTLMLSGDYASINMERASVGSLVKTYSANNRVTDSAASATAYSTGHKTGNSHLAVDTDGAPLETIVEKGRRVGLRAGLVATTHLMHATPAAFYAHARNRSSYEEIALQLLDSGIDVGIGGGTKYMTQRADGRNLMDEMRARGYSVTDNLAGLDAVTSGRALAIWDDAAKPEFVSDGRDPAQLARSTAKALEILAANSAASGSGFFLMVEGSKIDNAAHWNDPERLVGEMREFDNAVGVAFDWADTHPGTLVVVLADHETGGLTIPSGNENFLLPDSGVEFRWATRGHSGVMIPLLAYGAGAAAFGGIIDNTEVNRLIVRALRLE